MLLSLVTFLNLALAILPHSHYTSKSACKLSYADDTQQVEEGE